VAAETLLSLRLPAAAQSPRTHREENTNQRKVRLAWLTILHCETFVACLRKGRMKRVKAREGPANEAREIKESANRDSDRHLDKACKSNALRFTQAEH
jgi:hypothetical protein